MAMLEIKHVTARQLPKTPHVIKKFLSRNGNNNSQVRFFWGISELCPHITKLQFLSENFATAVFQQSKEKN